MRKDSHTGKSSGKGWVRGGVSAVSALGRQRGRRITTNSGPAWATQQGCISGEGKGEQNYGFFYFGGGSEIGWPHWLEARTLSCLL